MKVWCLFYCLDDGISEELLGLFATKELAGSAIGDIRPDKIEIRQYYVTGAS